MSPSPLVSWSPGSIWVQPAGSTGGDQEWRKDGGLGFSLWVPSLQAVALQ